MEFTFTLLIAGIAATIVSVVYDLIIRDSGGTTAVELNRLDMELRHHSKQIEHLMNQRDGEELAWELNCHDKSHHYEYKFGRIEYHNKNKSSDPFTGTHISTATMSEAKNRLNEILAKQHENCMNLSEEEQKIIRDRREADWDDRYVLLRKKEVAEMKKKSKKK